MNTSAAQPVLDKEDEDAVSPKADFRLGLALSLGVGFLFYGGMYLLFR